MCLSLENVMLSPRSQTQEPLGATQIWQIHGDLWSPAEVGGAGNEERLLPGDGVSFWHDGNSLEICRWCLHNLVMTEGSPAVSFMLCVF